MKNFLVTLVATCFFISSFGSIPIIKPALKADQTFVNIGSGSQKISLMQLSTISIKDFEILSGRHLNFFNRMAFKAGQKKLVKSIAKDGTVKNKKLAKLVGDGDHSTGFHIGGFALGLFLGLIGVLLAYVIGGDDDVKRNRAKWSWIGFGVGVVLSIILIVAALKSIDNN